MEPQTLLATFVIPVLNEEGNITPLVTELNAALTTYNLPNCEILFVNDGSTDGTVAEIESLMQRYPNIRLVHHDQRRRSSRSFRTGVEYAKAPWIVTLDGDGQNPPVEAVRLLTVALAKENGAPCVVCGNRQKRQDTLSKRLASKIANRIRRSLLRDGCPDTACALKVYPKAAHLDLPFFEGMHRFLPALFTVYGVPVYNEPVSHRERVLGVSKYTNWQRALVGITDLFGAMWLIRRTIKRGQITETTAKSNNSSVAA